MAWNALRAKPGISLNQACADFLFLSFSLMKKKQKIKKEKYYLPALLESNFL